MSTPFDQLSNLTINYLLNKTDFTDEHLGAFAGLAPMIKKELEDAKNRKLKEFGLRLRNARLQKQFTFNDDFYIED